jgi:hypothetical protein
MPRTNSAGSNPQSQVPSAGVKNPRQAYITLPPAKEVPLPGPSVPLAASSVEPIPKSHFPTLSGGGSLAGTYTLSSGSSGSTQSPSMSRSEASVKRAYVTLPTLPSTDYTTPLSSQSNALAASSSSSGSPSTPSYLKNVNPPSSQTNVPAADSSKQHPAPFPTLVDLSKASQSNDSLEVSKDNKQDKDKKDKKNKKDKKDKDKDKEKKKSKWFSRKKLSRTSSIPSKHKIKSDSQSHSVPQTANTKINDIEDSDDTTHSDNGTQLKGSDRRYPYTNLPPPLPVNSPAQPQPQPQPQTQTQTQPQTQPQPQTQTQTQTQQSTGPRTAYINLPPPLSVNSPPKLQPQPQPTVSKDQQSFTPAGFKATFMSSNLPFPTNSPVSEVKPPYTLTSTRPPKNEHETVSPSSPPVDLYSIPEVKPSTPIKQKKDTPVESSPPTDLYSIPDLKQAPPSPHTFQFTKKESNKAIPTGGSGSEIKQPPPYAPPPTPKKDTSGESSTPTDLYSVPEIKQTPSAHISTPSPKKENQATSSPVIEIKNPPPSAGMKKDFKPEAPNMNSNHSSHFDKHTTASPPVNYLARPPPPSTPKMSLTKASPSHPLYSSSHSTKETDPQTSSATPSPPLSKLLLPESSSKLLVSGEIKPLHSPLADASSLRDVLHREKIEMTSKEDENALQANVAGNFRFSSKKTRFIIMIIISKMDFDGIILYCS